MLTLTFNLVCSIESQTAIRCTMLSYKIILGGCCRPNSKMVDLDKVNGYTSILFTIFAKEFFFVTFLFASLDDETISVMVYI